MFSSHGVVDSVESDEMAGDMNPYASAVVASNVVEAIMS